MKTPAKERLKNRQRNRAIWVVIAGLILAVFLYLAIQISGALRPDTDETPIDPAPDKSERIGIRPVSFRQVSEFTDNGIQRLRLSGEAEAGAVVVITDRGERLRQVRANELGQWGLTLDVGAAPMALEAQLYVHDGAPGIRSEETVFRLPVPSGENVAVANYTTTALILVAAPGSPTRIIQSPFGGAPTSGPLSLSVIDYDDSGGVIITGTSSVPGRIRLYAQNNVIGETGIGVGGRWNYIAGRMLPRGEWEIRAELIPAAGAPNAPEQTASVSVPFALLPPLRRQGDESGALSVNFQPLYWQVRRTLIGGGGQSTVVFSPKVAEIGEVNVTDDGDPPPAE